MTLSVSSAGIPSDPDTPRTCRLLEAMTQYSYEQGLSVRKLDPDEMFATEAKAWSPGPDPFLTTRA